MSDNIFLQQDWEHQNWEQAFYLQNKNLNEQYEFYENSKHQTSAFSRITKTRSELRHRFSSAIAKRKQGYISNFKRQYQNTKLTFISTEKKSYFT